jgi:RimJ/RimL family protein N-acetyltransferase
LFVADDPPRLVGWGGFKGPPRNGTVELGYEIAESCRRRGHATAAVREMVAEAFAAENVTTVIAHTLPHRNPSNQLLERLGFRFDGEVRDSDELTWRFVLPRASSDAASHPAVR